MTNQNNGGGFSRTGSDLSAAMAGGKGPNAQDSVPSGTVVYYEAGAVTLRSGGPSGTTWISGGEGVLAARQQNFDDTIGRDLTNLNSRYQDRITHEVRVEHADGRVTMERQVRPGYEREARNAELQHANLMRAAEYQRLVAQEAIVAEDAAKTQKLVQLKGEAAKVDRRIEGDYARYGRSALQINPNRRK